MSPPFTPPRAQRTAEAYGTTAEIYPGVGHDLMLEPGWEAVADRIHRWVTGGD